ncbi:MAG: hypothetical protein WDA16_04485 [Candidatus Thermoplasmatota archaeon]
MRPFLALTLVLALFVPAAFGQEILPPPGAGEATIGGVSVAWWAGPTIADQRVNASVPAGGADQFWVRMATDDIVTGGGPLNVSGRTWFVNLSSTDIVFDNASLFGNVTVPQPADTAAFLTTRLHVPANAQGSVSLALNITILEQRGNQTVLLGSALQTLTLQVAAPAGLPSWAYALGGVLIVLVVGVTVYALRERNLRRRMRGTVRSQALREAELEEIAQKKPEQAAVIKQELRAQEQVREKRRDLQILEAKRADVEKNLVLLKKRHEMGALSKHQYDQMVAKKQAELAKLSAEIAEMEAADRDSSAAA